MSSPTLTGQHAVAPREPYFEPLAALFDWFTGLWDTHAAGFTSWLTANLPRHATAGRALDLGCGAGRHSLLLAERYRYVLAVDTAKGMLDRARERRSRRNLDYQQRDVLGVSAAFDGSFDLVLSVHTLHHVGAPDLVLPHVGSLVAPGGTAILADIIDPGQWTAPGFHIDRAFADARAAYQATGERTAAANTLQLLLHPSWLAAAAADTPLTRELFHQHYTAVFPGVSIIDDLHPLMAGAVWHNTTPAHAIA